MNKSHAPFHIRHLAAAAFLAAAGAACVGSGGSGGGTAVAPSPEATAATPSATSTSTPGPTTNPGDVLVTIGPISPSQTPSGTPRPVASATHVSESTSAPLRAATLTEADNGKSVRVVAGAGVELVLHNVYWHVAGSSAPSILKPAGSPVYSGAGTLKCIPGTGCGTVTATFQAVAAGTARITATRTTCGEALQCVGDAGVFEVTLVVVP